MGQTAQCVEEVVSFMVLLKFISRTKDRALLL